MMMKHQRSGLWHDPVLHLRTLLHKPQDVSAQTGAVINTLNTEHHRNIFTLHCHVITKEHFLFHCRVSNDELIYTQSWSEINHHSWCYHGDRHLNNLYSGEFDQYYEMFVVLEQRWHCFDDCVDECLYYYNIIMIKHSHLSRPMTRWSFHVLNLHEFRGTEDTADFTHVINTHCAHVPETHTRVETLIEQI